MLDGGEKRRAAATLAVTSGDCLDASHVRRAPARLNRSAATTTQTERRSEQLEQITRSQENLQQKAGQIESLGARLFEKIEGDFFTIQGLPLLPLLEYLENEQGIGL